MHVAIEEPVEGRVALDGGFGEDDECGALGGGFGGAVGGGGKAGGERVWNGGLDGSGWTIGV